MREHYETLREFRTPNFYVVADYTEDYDADLSFDETGETLANLQSGKWQCFTVRVRVVHSELGEVGADYLGGCIYADPREFMDHIACARVTRKLRAEHGPSHVCGSYFADMIRSAIAEARKHIVSIRAKSAATYVRVPK